MDNKESEQIGKRRDYIYWHYLDEGQRYFGNDSIQAWIDIEYNRIEKEAEKPDWWNSTK